MSGIEDVNTSKDEDDLLKEDHLDLHTEHTPSNIEDSSQTDVSAKLVQETPKKLLEDINKAPGDNITDIHAASKHSANMSTSKNIESGVGDTTVTANVNEKSNDEGNNLKVADDEFLEDEDLELRWDDVENSDTSIEAGDDSNKIDHDLEEQLLEEPRDTVNKNVKELTSDMEKQTELSLEEELLKEKVTSSEITVESEPVAPMELHEDNVLDTEIKQSTMDIDIDKDIAVSNNVKEITKVIDYTSKMEETPAVDDENINLETSLPVIEKINETSHINTEDFLNSTENNNQNQDISMDIDANISQGSPTPLKISHRLRKPDVMLEIPTQELIDIDDVLDSPNDSQADESNLTVHGEESMEYGDEDLVEESLNEVVGDQNVGTDNFDDEALKELDNEVEENPTCVLKASSCEVSEPIPSTSSYNPHTPDTHEVPEVSDHLGLLAESCRVMQDYDDGDPDADEDNDFDQDESSNQMTAEHSEDSNAVNPEDQAREETDGVETASNQCEEEFTIDELEIEEKMGDEEIMPELPESNETIQIKKETDYTISNEKSDIQKKEDVKKVKEESVTEAVKKENEQLIKEDSVKVEERSIKKKKEEKIVLKEVEESCSSPVSSNDDVIEQFDDIETFKVSDDEDEEENNIQNKLEETDTLSSDNIVDKTVEQNESKKTETTENDVEEKTVDLKKNKELENNLENEKVKSEEISSEVDKAIKIENNTGIEKATEKEKNEDLKLATEVDKTGDLEKATEIENAGDISKATQIEKTVADEKATEKIIDVDIGKTDLEENDKKNEENIVQNEKNVMKEKDLNTIDLTPDPSNEESTPSIKSSPKKMKNFTVSTMVNTNVLSIVELEESSSEEDNTEKYPEHTVSELKKLLETSHKPPPLKTQNITTVNIPTGIDVMSTSTVTGSASQILTKEGDLTKVVISGVPKTTHKPARLNTSEVTIKTASASNSEQTLVIAESKTSETPAPVPSLIKQKQGLEIFNLDSDDEEPAVEDKQPEKRKKNRKCINGACSSGLLTLQAADVTAVAYYDPNRKKKPLVCQVCADAVMERKQSLIAGIKNLTPLLKLDMSIVSKDLVEILDSESEDEELQEKPAADTIGEETAKFLEENLADLLNETWKKYNLDERLKETQDEINAEITKLDAESKEINEILTNCQRMTDKLRSDLYATFEPRIKALSPLLIFETPDFTYIGPDDPKAVPTKVLADMRGSAKRKLPPSTDMPAKRAAIPLGYTPLDTSTLKQMENKLLDTKADDDKDISVVKLSVEAAPPDLPAPGEITRPPLRVGMSVYAMKNAFGPWFKGKIMEIFPKNSVTIFTTCRIKFDHKLKNNCKVLPARCIAYAEPADVRMTIGTRMIALFKDASKRESYYSGVVAEIPNPVNNYRYLVFFDDGYAQYVSHGSTRLVCECSPLVWEEVHPLSREFVREYLMAYPERPMVRLHEGQHLKTEWDGKWWPSRVCRVDASLAQVSFVGSGRREWIYRGSTRLAPLYLELRAAERHRPRPVPRSTQPRSNMMPYVEYTRSDEQTNKTQEQPTPVALTTHQRNEEIRRQRAVAKKSTAVQVPPSASFGPTPASGVDPEHDDTTVTSRVVYYTPKVAIKPLKIVPHKCSIKCKRTDVLPLKELRTYNPLAKPLLSGWERQVVRYKGQRDVMYRAPCGRRLRNMAELHRYLRTTDSELPVDLFDFHPSTHCLAEFVLNKCNVGKKDLSHGKENVPVPCVNYYDNSLPEFCSYNTERTPTSGVPLNLDPEFLCGCDCTDDCEDKSKCACWQLTLEGARTIGLEGVNVGYEYKRLPEPLPSGIYECNSRCKCKQTCLNRVAQHPLQLKLQVFKTLNRGWGIRALNDVPKGAFLCVYAGNLLTDATANLDGLNEGDEYLAELDYIEVVEQMKEGYEEDIPEADKKIGKESEKDKSEEESSSSSEEEENASKYDKEDDDFRPGYIALGVTDFNKRLRKRDKIKKEPKHSQDDEKDNKGSNPEEDCITISDDDEVREPSRFTANPGMGGSEYISKYRSVRTLFGEDEACYIMDAKVQGNIGRYLNHSCAPNVFVQNVFVDTHDPRFPWVAFFALSHIKAGTELTWNYNYDVGSVPGKVLYCYCEAPNCRGRLL